MVTIKQGGSKKYGAYTAGTAPASGFNSPVKTWVGTNATILLGKDYTLEPGDYELCAQLFWQGPAGIEAISDEKCKPFTIKETKEQNYTPPVNITPADKKIFTENEIKSPITFRWTPLCCRPSNPPDYRLNVWQVGEGKNAAQVMQTEKPLISEMIKTQTQFTYRKGWDGKGNYVWRVEAIDGQGKVLGVSEATGFGVANTLPNVTSGCNSNCTLSVELFGQPNNIILNPTTTTTLNCGKTYDVVINNLKCAPADATIRIKKITIEDANGQTPTWVTTAWQNNALNNILDIPNNITLTNYKLIYSWGTSVTNICDHVDFPINITCGSGNSTITCGSWQQLKYEKNNVFQSLLSCGSTTPISIPLNTTIKLSGGIDCSTNGIPGPSATGSFTIYKNNGTPVLSDYGFIANYKFIDCGSYKVVFKGKCGTTTCPIDCIINFDVTCPPNCIPPTPAPYVGPPNPITYIQNTVANPLIASGLSILWYTTAAGGVGSANTPTPSTAILGTTNYWVSQTVNGCESPRTQITVIVVNCCTGSHFGTIDLDGNNITCNATITPTPVYNCNALKPIHSTFICGIGGNCTATIKYVFVTPITGVPISTPVLSASGANAFLTFPNVAGNYCLKIYGLCNGLACDSCLTCFTVQCPPPNCCQGSHFVKTDWKGVSKVKCDTTISKLETCNSPQVVNYTFVCGANSCDSKIDYVIKDVNGNTVSTVHSSSGIDQNITMPPNSGNYCLVAYGICNGVVCDSCKVCFNVTCNNCDGIKILPISGTGVGLNHTPASASVANVSVNFTSGKTMNKIVAQLAMFMANNHPITLITNPAPNFEFANPGTGITFPYSLLGTRSNIAVTTFSASSYALNLQIDNMQNKDIKYCQIKFTIFFTDGTYCEQFKEWLF